MNKAEFINYISEKHSCTKVEAEKAINMVTSSVIDALGQGNAVSFVGFGNFSVGKVAARNGTHPQTGKSLKIAAYNKPKFKAGQKLKDAVNNK